MTKARIKLGKKGENKARVFLQNKGYKFLGQNIKYNLGEVDLLMQDGEDLVIIEVKTKENPLFGTPQDEVDYHKRKKLLQLAKTVWQKNPQRNVRIDVLAIDENSDTIEHIVSAVED